MASSNAVRLPGIIPPDDIAQPYSAKYLASLATFILRADFQTLHDIFTAQNKQALAPVLSKIRTQPHLSPIPTMAMTTACKRIVRGINLQKEEAGISRDVIPLALMLLWQFSEACQRDREVKGKAGSWMDYEMVVIAMHVAHSGISDTEIKLVWWKNLTSVSVDVLKFDEVVLLNAIRHHIVPGEMEFQDFVWRIEKLWEEVLKELELPYVRRPVNTTLRTGGFF